MPSNRKKSKPPIGLIQISSKSRLSSWSKPTSRPKSHSQSEGYTDDSSFASRHSARLCSLPTSLSDSCLAKRRLEDSDDFKVSSAPESSGSSVNDDEEDDSGETEDMEQYDPCDNNASQGSAVDGKVLPVGETKSAQLEDENVELPSAEGVVTSERQTSRECGFVVGDDPEGEQRDQPETGNNDNGPGNFEKGEMSAGNTDSHKHATNDKNAFNSMEKEEMNCSEDQEIEDELNEITGDQITLGKAQQKTLEGDISTEVNATEHKTKSLLHQGNGEIRSKEHKGGSSGDDHEGPQVSFHGTSAAMRISHSSVELGTMASAGDDNNRDKSPERRRFGARFPGNRGLKIFATAQARGRTLIPELRSKLSSFSQQVRSRSPRASPKRPSLHNDSNSEQKQLRRKCRTKIIEL